MSEKEYFEKLKAEGRKGNDYVYQKLFNLDNQGKIISSKEGVWFSMMGSIPVIETTTIPRSELEKFISNSAPKEDFRSKLQPSDNPSLFTSKEYPFSKEWSNYNPTNLGRAFFSDGIVDGVSGLKVYDPLSILDKFAVNLKNDPYFSENKEIALFVYTSDNPITIKDKYNKLSLMNNEIGIFALAKENTIDFNVKMSNNLFENSRFKTSTEMESFLKTIPIEAIKNKDISTKWLIDLFKDDEKQLLDSLNVYTKEDIEKYQNPAISTFVKKDFPKSAHRPQMKVKTIDVTLGMFFDGTGNNRFATELIYNQNIDSKTLILDEEAIKKLKGANTTHPVTKKKEKVEDYMVNLEGSTSYLNPYSNIVLLHDLYQSNSDKFNKHTTLNQNVVFKQYVQGIGTKVDLDQNGVPTQYNKDDILGSASGRGEQGIIGKVEQVIHDSVLQIKKFLKENNKEIRILTIDVFGFSRGAAAARHYITEILKPEIKENTQQMLNQQGQIEYAPAQLKFGLLGSEFKKQGIEIPAQIDIRFTGLFDTVVADFSEKGYFTKSMIELPAIFTEPSNVLYEKIKNYEKINTSLENLKSKVMHIIAMDEYRENFPLTISDAPNTYNLYLYGSHSDIGGGYSETSYKTILEYKDIKDSKELKEYDKVADSYRTRFSRELLNGKWVIAQKEISNGKIKTIIKQISLVKIEDKYNKPGLNSNLPPQKISESYIIKDNRFITNKISIVSMNAMLQGALIEKVPFLKDSKKYPKHIIKTNKLNKQVLVDFYSIINPKTNKVDSYLQNYYDGIEKMVIDEKINKYQPSNENYFPLYQHYIHFSANYNIAKVTGAKGTEALDILYVNHPTSNKKRKYLKPKK
jgi:hypothetical protein